MSDVEPGRRSLLIALASFGALATFVSGASLTLRVLGLGRRQHEKGPGLPSPDVLAFLGPLAEAVPFEQHRVLTVEPIRDGALTLIVQTPNAQRFEIDVRARGAGAPPGVAETDRLALYVRSASRGAPTPDAAIRACQALARALSAREASGATPPKLNPMR